MTRAAAIIVLDQIKKAFERKLEQGDVDASTRQGCENIRDAYTVALEALRALEPTRGRHLHDAPGSEYLPAACLHVDDIGSICRGCVLDTIRRLTGVTS